MNELNEAVEKISKIFDPEERERIRIKHRNATLLCLACSLCFSGILFKYLDINFFLKIVLLSANNLFVGLMVYFPLARVIKQSGF